MVNLMATGTVRALAGEYQPADPYALRSVELVALGTRLAVVAFVIAAAYGGLFPMRSDLRDLAAAYMGGYHVVYTVYAVRYRLRGAPIPLVGVITPFLDTLCVTTSWVALDDPNSPSWAFYLYGLVGYGARVGGGTYAVVVAFNLVNVIGTMGYLEQRAGGGWYTHDQVIGGVAFLVTAILIGTVAGALRRSELEARRLARTDALTGIPNRRTFMESIDELDSVETTFAVLMVDLDNFKQLNDDRGHLEGDRILGVVAEVLSANLRPGDSVARYGGEEFVIITSAGDLAHATEIAERLRIAVRDSAGVTVSVGVAVRRPGESAVMVIRRADDLLRDAKRAGKDRVVAAALPAAA
jgi:diguanylate cyclase (GGDEF)-like protein